jgi:hypothetical protein
MKMVSRHPLLLGTTSLILVSLTLYGCKDFLTNAADPQAILNEQTLQNKGGVEGTLVGAYRPLDCTTSTGAWGCSASDWPFATVPTDESYKGSTSDDQPPINDLEAYHWSAPNGQMYLNDKWKTVYEGVVRANSTIRLLNAVVSSKPGELSTADANGILGEALFLRAYYHFEAWRMWGNIPYYREDDTDFRKANMTSDQVVVEILKDLDAAIAKLPLSPRNAQKGRVTQWTAKAYKGRLQVYAGQFAAGLATLRDIQANGPYALETSFDHVWTGFPQYENGKETIFAYEASTNDGEPGGNNSNVGERLNFPYSGSHFGCCGFNQPTQNLVNFFKVDAQGLPLALSSPTTWNASNVDFVAGSTAPVDPRLDWTVGRDGVPYKDWGPVSLAKEWVRDTVNGGPYSPKKNAHEKASGSESQATGGWQPTQLNGVNIHLFRYADLLLLLAEAEVEAGSLANATTIVNQIRARAAVAAQGPGTGATDIAVPINDPRITWAVYQIGQYPVFANQAYAREAVRAERRLELAGEGQRMWDLRRWGNYIVVLNGYLDGVGGGNEKSRRPYLTKAEAVAAKHRWYPIPDIQIQMSKVNGTSRLTQNTGW